MFFVVHRRGFTLIELLVVLGILGTLAAIVITAISPKRQLTAASDSWRQSAAREIKNALTQYVIDEGSLPAGIPIGSSNALPICREDQAGETGCVDLDIILDEDYLTDLPVDSLEGSGALTGFTVYRETGGFITVTPSYLGVE